MNKRGGVSINLYQKVLAALLLRGPCHLGAPRPFSKQTFKFITSKVKWLLLLSMGFYMYRILYVPINNIIGRDTNLLWRVFAVFYKIYIRGK